MALLKINVDILLSWIEANARRSEQSRLKTPQDVFPEEAEAVPAERERSEQKSTTDFNRAFIIITERGRRPLFFFL
ncbi:hypothetical protein CR205_11635 [Alteribacter lacisalsi]|uniref:Uncharacterized protein n=1 Tax=Alteribacter lacisalsi TaxID=2045244 RepID=A0A2W0H5S3_9BACI|nr:hypothetical protein CR205_11635 [Alteribacter lacisalsi]